MYKILVVDDFLPDRKTIIEMLAREPFLDMQLQIVGECEDGLQALKAIETTQPDIVISDIEMPLCNGLELARNIRFNHPRIKIIFCSLYDEFEYARKALYFGGYGYILKPLDSEELKLCIQRVTGQLASEANLVKNQLEYEEIRRMLTEYKPVLAEDFLKSLIYGENIASEPQLWEKVRYLGINLSHGDFQLAYAEIDDFDRITQADSTEKQQIFSMRVFNRVQEALEKHKGFLVLRLNEAHFLIIHQSSMGASPIADGLEQILIEFNRSDVSLTIGISEPREQLKELKDMYQQCLYLMKHKYLLGKGKLIFPGDVPLTTWSNTLDFNAIQKDVMFLLNAGTQCQITEYVDQFFKRVSHCADIQYFKNLCFYVVICMQTQLQENNETLKAVLVSTDLIWEELLRFETANDAADWIKNSLVKVNQYLAAKSKSSSVQLVEKIKQYVDENYGKDVRIENMAADLFYSPNYLNRIFKQETGETILEYVTALRIEKAKVLLQDPGVKLSSISETLGYGNPAYFSFLFKKATGLTLKEYRERRAV